jgi:glycosyltransferase involved in cell wall biosynthesis
LTDARSRSKPSDAAPPRLRIAQVAPLFEAVPPAAYGGTELIAHLVTEELVRRGHEVTLFASGDSFTHGRLVPGSEAALWSARGRRLSPSEGERLRREHHARPYERRDEFDLIHEHGGQDGLAAAVEAGAERVLVTHHRESDDATIRLLAGLRGRHNAVSASAAATFPPERQMAPVLHGIDVASYPFGERAEGYLLFLGRFAPQKGAGTAVQVARRTGRRLLLAGRIHDHDRPTFERDVEPFLDDRIRYVGEAGGMRKRFLLAGADALIFPISWNEPFGLVMIEALSCGTPVLATRRASTPEVIDPGETGFLAGPGDGSEADVEALAAALPHLPLISRARCRQAAETHFTVGRMVDDYERRYAELLGMSTPAATGPTGASSVRQASGGQVVDDDLVREARSPQ